MNLTDLSLPIPLSQRAYECAAQFAAEQANLNHGKRIYLNTLAVYAVHTYCNWLEIETDLTQSDCWQPGLRAIFDVADLVIPGIGKLECRPVMPGATSFTVPLDAVRDRIGYVAVQFHESSDTVELLGFVEAPMPPELVVEPLAIALTDLLSLDALLKALHPEEAIVNLRAWLEGIFEQSEWKTPETLLKPRRRPRSGSSSKIGGSPAMPSEMYAQLKSVSRAKAIELTATSRQTVVLVVQVVSTIAECDRLNVRLRLYPDSQSNYLPRHLKITVLDESGEVLLEAQTRDEDVYIDLGLSDCHPAEQFSVRVTLNDLSVIERFVI